MKLSELRSRIPRIRSGDLIAILTAVLAITAVSIAAYSGIQETATEVVVQAEEQRFLYSLENDRRLTFSGPLGKTVVKIEGGAVSVVEDPGPLQICVRKGAVSRPGEWLACLPNEVFVRVTGPQPADAVDGQTY